MSPQVMVGEALRLAASCRSTRRALRNTQSRAVAPRRVRVLATIATEKPSVESSDKPASSSDASSLSLANILAPVRTDMDILQQNLENVSRCIRDFCVRPICPLAY